MSLIQAALNKAGQTQTSAKQAPKPVVAARLWTNSVLEQGLEKELRKVQDRHKTRRFLWLKIITGAILIVAACALFFMSAGNKKAVPQELSLKKTVVIPAPEPLDSGSLPAEFSRPGEISKLTVPASGSLPSVQAHSPAALLPPSVLSEESYRLSGITDLGDQPRAIINDQIVSVGDLVSQKALVKEIGYNEVLLEVKGQKIRLKM